MGDDAMQSVYPSLSSNVRLRNVCIASMIVHGERTNGFSVDNPRARSDAQVAAKPPTQSSLDSAERSQYLVDCSMELWIVFLPSIIDARLHRIG
jgi:hypothetical protein